VPVDLATPNGRLDRRLAWALFALGFLVLLLTEQPVGFTRDESQYFHAGESYARWFQLLASNPSQALTDEAITRAFDFNHEHPVLMKVLFGLSYLLLNEGLHLLRPAAAFRVPAFAVAALLLPLIYLLARRRLGRGASLFAAVSFFLVPRQFFHSHLSCFDVPIATMWVLVVYCFAEALSRPRWWLYTGLAFGAALATKHNAYFLPLVLIPFSLYRGWTASEGQAAARRLFLGVNATFVFGAALFALLVAVLGPERFQASFTLQSPQVVVFVAALGVGGALLRLLWLAHPGTFRAVAPLYAMAALGPAVYYLHWPYLWHHPVDRTAWYIAFHATHNHYTWYYLGELLRAPPFPLEYVVALTALTVPTAIFTAMALGTVAQVVRVARRQGDLFDVLLLVNAAASIAIISHPDVPHFGGVKHWFPSMPFLAVFAGASLERGAAGLTEALGARWRWLTPQRALAGLAVLVGASGFIATARVYEFGTSAYAEAAGGLPGAASLGMQRQYWANNLTGVLDWLNQNLRPGERVYLHENHGMQVSDYLRNGMLRRDLSFVGGPFEADTVVYQYHQEFREAEFNAWQALGTTRPVYGLYLDETPQIVIYRRGYP
jgi:4-amino-4-deoxy-L-arabinose transferase-like glycosyltransferase